MTVILIFVAIIVLAWLFFPYRLGKKGTIIPFVEPRTASPTYPEWYNDQPPIYEAKRFSVLYPKDFTWVAFVCKNLDNLYEIAGNRNYNEETPVPKYFKIKGYDNFVINFSYSWMWHIYRGKDAQGISNSFDEGGTSNLADYLTPAQLKMGVKIQNWYIDYIDRAGCFYIENCGYSRESIILKPELQKAG